MRKLLLLTLTLRVYLREPVEQCIRRQRVPIDLYTSAHAKKRLRVNISLTSV